MRRWRRWLEGYQRTRRADARGHVRAMWRNSRNESISKHDRAPYAGYDTMKAMHDSLALQSFN
jgi:hypothetical protein